MTSLQRRQDFLRRSQNADGGWGYFAGPGQSWLEPTCYALLTLHADPQSAATAAKAWKKIETWQLPDGAWHPNDLVKSPSWATALAVLLHCVSGRLDARFQKAADWLVASRGSEGGWFERSLNAVRKLPVEYDRRFKGWPWSPDAASWIEPTAHSLLALKKAAAKLAGAQWKARIEEGERMLADRRCADGGWNHGNRRVLDVDLPSYPETTAVALLALQGSQVIDWKPAMDRAERHYRETNSPLAKAWLAIALRTLDRDVPEPSGEPSPDVLLCSLQALSCPAAQRCFKL